MKAFLLGLLLSIITVLAPVKGFLVVISVFVFADTAFAIYVTIKKKGRTSYQSHKLFNIAIKTFFYMGSIIMGFLIDWLIFDGSIMGINHIITKALTLLYCYIEIKSLDETSMKLGNKSLWVLFKELINKGKDLKKDFNDIINKDE